jgi:hypothetical protein
MSTYHSQFANRPEDKAADKAEDDRATLERFRHRAAGIWPVAAFLNHDCSGNVERSFIGDALILRAASDLPARAELTTPYVSPTDPAAAEKLLEYWGIECHCAICADERRTTPAEQRRRSGALLDAGNAISGQAMLRNFANLSVGGSGGLLASASRRLGMSSDLSMVESRVVAAARAFAQPVPAGAADDGSAAASQWIPRPKLAALLRRLSQAYERAASEVPSGPGSTAADSAKRRAHADKAIKYSLEALRQLGYVIRESGGRWDDDAVGTENVGLADSADGDASLSAGEPPVHRRLVVEKWGACTSDVRQNWFRIARTLLLGGAPAALIDEAKAYARTSYCIMIGEAETFEREYAKATTDDAGEEEAKNTLNTFML